MPFRLFRSVVMISALSSAVNAESTDDRLAYYCMLPGLKVEIGMLEPLVVNPANMPWGPDNRLYVVDGKAGRVRNDHIKVRTHKDGDGTFKYADVSMDGFDGFVRLTTRDRELGYQELPNGACESSLVSERSRYTQDASGPEMPPVEFKR